MLTTGDEAPSFSAPLATGENYGSIMEFTFTGSNHDEPFVLAFYPAAFSGGCTEEMCAIRDRLMSFNDLGAKVYGISADLPFAQNAFIAELELNFPMISDSDRCIADAYGVTMEEEIYGIPGMANRSIFVIDREGTIEYSWVRTGDANPDFTELIEEVATRVEGL